MLTQTPVPFAFKDSETELYTCKPIIEVDSEKLIREVRFSNLHVQPLRLSPERVSAFYEAYRRFAELVYAPDMQLTFNLDPGDCVIFDNTRILHARTAFASGGARHLQGAYADSDGLASSLATLTRRVSDAVEYHALIS